MIEEWLAGAVGKMIVVGLVVLGIICTPAAIYFGVRYEGIYIPKGVPFLGGDAIIDGAKNYKAERDLAVTNLGKCQTNEGTLQGEIKKQSQKYADLQATDKKKLAAGDKQIAVATANGAALQARIAALLKANPLDTRSPGQAVMSIEALAEGGLKQ